MTAQLHERLRYEGQGLSMCTTPLGDYFRLGGVSPGFEFNCTALWRGYVGSWEIVGERLYLVELTGTLKNGDQACVATVFPDFPDRVFAHWYSGTIRVPRGKLLDYVHMGCASTYENDLFIEFERGVIKSTRLTHNGIAGPNAAPAGTEVSAFTVFPRGVKTPGDAP